MGGALTYSTLRCRRTSRSARDTKKACCCVVADEGARGHQGAPALSIGVVHVHNGRKSLLRHV